MPIPAAPEGRGDVASTVLTLFEQLHGQIREEIIDLDEAGLNWSPGEGANTIATIVTHVLGSEAETLRCVAGVASVRDRDGEFVGGPQRVADVLDTLRTADELLTALQPQIDGRRLRRASSLPTLPVDERRSGLTWLVGNYGHAREHLGHIQLTGQLYRAASTAT
jgi:hypothetical protein